MKIYNYDPITGEYLSSKDARPDPMTEGRFLIPAFATDIEPPDPKEGYAIIFAQGGWNYVVDHRGQSIYSTENAERATVTGIGPIPERFTVIEPIQHSKWDGAKWVEDTDALKEAESNEIKARLAEMDLKSISLMRAFIVSKFPDAPIELKELESSAFAEKVKIK